MLTAEDVFRAIASEEKAKPTINKVAGLLGIDAKDGPAVARVAELVGHLAAAGRIHTWESGRGRTLVTLSSVEAYRLRLKLNDASTRWRMVGDEDRPIHVTPEVTDAGRVFICETDLTEVPPGAMARVPDNEKDEMADPEVGLVRVLADERRLGLRRPTLPMVGCLAWTPENWERAPGSHLCDPLDDPRRVPDPGDEAARRKRMKPDKLRELRSGEPCPVCHGRELRAMIGLVSRKAGKNRAPRPPELVEGGEHCCKCNRDWQDGRWPRVTRLPESKIGNKNESNES